MENDKKLISQQKYVWEYFKLHASQRLTTFNFYIVIFTFLCTGYALTFKSDTSNEEIIRFVISFLLFAFSLIFYFLDKRSKVMIKMAEKALRMLENSILGCGENQNGSPLPFHIFEYEKYRTKKLKKINKYNCFWRKHYSYSDCFQTIFMLGTLLGSMSFLAQLLFH